ncbi:50S ribosomal protein L6, partial [Candidatus Gottesmanbacteria bacterium RBG_16_43_7]
MSRIGNIPINIPKDVTCAVTNSAVSVKGSKGELTVLIPVGIAVKNTGDTLVVEIKSESRKSKPL